MNMQRITQKMLEGLCDTLNELMGYDTTPYRSVDGKYTPSPHNMHLDWAYSGVMLAQFGATGSGISCPLGSYHRPKKQMGLEIQAMIDGIRIAQQAAA
jgi:hypothetical protein